ncbi:MAG: hypothetical protein ACJA0P_003737 [Planctomycetota bacterium]|jgi:hypothetical protein
MSKRITKTRYLLGRQCSRRQWLSYHEHPEPAVTAPEVKELYVTGSREVEELAAGLFPGAVHVHREGTVGLSPDAYVGAAGSVAALEASTCVIQAHFEVGDLLAVSDIVEVREQGIFLWEVKSSVYKEGRATALQDWDVAFQMHVAREAGYRVLGGGLILINPEYVRGEGEVVAAEALVKMDRTFEVETLAPDVAMELQQQRSWLTGADMPDELPSSRCKEGRKAKAGNRPSGCGHLPAGEICGSALPVFWAGKLPDLTGKKAVRLTSTAGLKVEDLDADDAAARWSPLQRRVIEAVQARDEFVDPVALRAKLDEVQWPVAYVDFEFDPTMAIPRHTGMRSYERVPFQWAVCVERAPGGGLGAVASFLELSGDDPTRDFAASLLAALPETGSIVAHHEDAEIAVLEQVAGRLGGEVAERLLALIPRFIDTEKVARAGYYHPDQMSSYSIKRLAPALTGRGYDGLAIGDGMLAVAEWRRALRPETSAEEREAVRANLLEYCGLDAALMHDILERLRELSGAAT